MPNPDARRVLVVASDPVVLSTIQGAVSQTGWLMESIAEAPAAIDFVRRSSPDLLCIDLGVAGEPGFELCRSIRGDAALQHTWIIGICDQATMESVKKAESVGVNAYIKKPLTREKFIKYATELLQRRFDPPPPSAGIPGAAMASGPVAPSSSNGEDIAIIMITLNVGSDPSLFILLSSDGTINRMGNGSIDPIERHLFIDRIDLEVFRRIRASITPGVLHWLGQVLVAPEPKGKLCELELAFQRGDGRGARTKWRYGSKSQGPHPEVCAFVATVVEATNPWYEERMKLRARTR
jgi:DNA-binding response OmpR family regulator